jgi:hypothetical protein
MIVPSSIKLAACFVKVAMMRNNEASTQSERIMAKGQQKSNKEGKKPKKDTSPAKVPTGEPMRAAIVTAVIPRGKDKNKK